MDDQRIDLSPLDPARDPARWERLVAGILHRAAPELARRAAAERSVLYIVADWAKPAFATAAALAALAFGTLAGGAASEGAPSPLAHLVDALEPPSDVAGWMMESQPAPTVSELIVVLGGEAP